MNTNPASSSGSDKLVLYASLFLYNPKSRSEYSSYAPSVSQYECKIKISLEDKICNTIFPLE